MRYNVWIDLRVSLEGRNHKYGWAYLKDSSALVILLLLYSL